MTLIPAHGRDYKSAKAVRADWNAGKDFLVCDMSNRWDGKPANKDSFPNELVVIIRFDNMRKAISVPAQGD